LARPAECDTAPQLKAELGQQRVKRFT